MKEITEEKVKTRIGEIQEDYEKVKKDKDKKEPGLELSSPGIYIDKLLYGLGCNKRLYSKSSFIISIALTNEGFRGFITLK